MMDRVDKLRAAVDTVLDTLRQHGFRPSSWDNGDGFEPLLANTADEIMSVEECLVRFWHPDRDRAPGWIHFILCNDPEEIVADHSMPADGYFTNAVDAAMKAIEEA